MTTDFSPAMQQLRQYQEHFLASQRRERALQEIAAARTVWTGELDQLRVSLAEGTVAREQTDAARLTLERELTDIKAKLAEREVKAFAIKTNKEYQAALKEIAEGKQTVKQKEDQILELMGVIEERTKNNTQLSAAIADTEASGATQLAQWIADEQQMRREREEHLASATQIEAAIAPKIMEQYRYVQRRHPDALSVVVANGCGVCRMKVAPQLLVDLRKGVRVINCQACHRILCWDDQGV